jgi:hypothetical protein
MPAVLAAFATYLVSAVIMRFFIATGLSIITFYFVNDLVDQAKVSIQNAFYGLPADALSFIQLYKIDQCVSVILSALSIAAFVKTAKAFIGRK